MSVRGSRYAVPLAEYRSPIEVRIRALTCELYVETTWLVTYAWAPGRGAVCTTPLARAPTRAWLAHDVERRDLAVYETVGAHR